MIERVSYAGWDNCYRLTDGEVELIATSDIGPRIVWLGFVGGENVFGELEDQLGLVGGDEWLPYGGHRFWHSPEAMPRSYYPDNEPIQVETEGEEELRLIQPPESTTGMQKTMEVTLAEDHVEVAHTLRNEGLWPVEAAPWALSVMTLGSVAIIPQPQGNPEALLPNRTLMLWPYTDMTDPRVHWGHKFILLRQDPTIEQRIKLGLNVDDGWCASLVGETLFLKGFDVFEEAIYPDNGCTVEAYTDNRFLELETLGPLAYLEPGESTTHMEYWYLFGGVRCDLSDEDDIERALRLGDR
ncbi:MAG: hypothetical protein U9Q78_02280 [Chloroflexota bacterium]|nr:hypothetical protein [Chloroflexota bacterium]